MNQWNLGIDLGGTKTFLGRISSQGEIERDTVFPTNAQRTYGEVLNSLIEHCQDFLSTHQEKPCSVGVGVAGQVDPASGTVSFAPNLNWQNAPLQRDLEKALCLPVKVLNDVQAATWGEAHFFHKNASSLLGVFIGTGIGGGFVYEGKLIKGSFGSFGEIGHMAVAASGPSCRCGRLGCLEAIASGYGLEREAKKRAVQEPNQAQTLLKLAQNNPDQITAILLFEAYKQGDLLATSLIEKAIEALATAFASFINLFNPEVIVLGGGAMKGYLPFLQEIERQAKEQALPYPAQKTRFVQAQLRKNSAAIGVASYFEIDKNQIKCCKKS